MLNVHCIRGIGLSEKGTIGNYLDEFVLTVSQQEDIFVTICLHREVELARRLLDRYQLQLSFRNTKIFERACYDRDYQLLQLLLEKYLNLFISL